MKIAFLIFFTLVMISPGCDMQKRRQALEEKEIYLNQKEQQLLLRESALKLKEEELAKKETLLDSISVAPDTLLARYPFIPGNWNVNMRCTETTCTGSAVGDTKTEQWQISIQDNKVTAKAMSDNKLLRIYTGSYVGELFELTAQVESPVPLQGAKMVVRLHPSDQNTFQDNAR